MLTPQESPRRKQIIEQEVRGRPAAEVSSHLVITPIQSHVTILDVRPYVEIACHPGSLEEAETIEECSSTIQTLVMNHEGLREPVDARFLTLCALLVLAHPASSSSST